ncbi:PREDICTED: uncharacterized protein LOC104604974, partial [Nelumbo nucifera]
MEETSSSSEGEFLEGATEIEDNAEIHKEDLLTEEDGVFPLETGDNIEDADDSETEREESLKVAVKTSYEIKLRELLRNIHSVEIEIYSEASNEFIRLLRGDSGGELLSQYVQASPMCSELVEVWKLRQGKPGMSHVLSLISTILDHSDGKYKPNDIGRITISRRLDKLARSIIESKLEDVYAELNSKEASRQNAALLLLAAVVGRGVGLASEVAKNFDFKLSVFPKLAEYQQKKVGKKGKHSTRKSFIKYAMSFLDIGNPRLLRWVLQQKDMYSGVLRGLGSDDSETVIYVLSTLRDRVLVPESLVPPGLRSVLFGTVTLDQLVSISGNPLGGPAAEIAHQILVMVCTDPHNGLMPDLKAHPNPLRGNPKRLLDLMKKLKATEIGYHRDLLLAIVNGRPSLGSAYMDEFPYILEPRESDTWFAAISLAADLVSSASMNIPFGSTSSQPQDPPSLKSPEVQCLLKCFVPRLFSRMVIDRGLRRTNVAVKHGSLRLLLEALKSLDNLLGVINCFCSSNPAMQKWVSLKQEIQDEARALLPDPQVLLMLLSSLSYSHSSTSKSRLKRDRKSVNSPEVHDRGAAKKLKYGTVNEDADILISGINAEPDTTLQGEIKKVTGAFITEELDSEMELVKVIAGIWGLNKCSLPGNELKDPHVYFHSKLLDALTLYLRTMPIGAEGAFDFFKLLPSDPLTLSSILQRSLLSLLVEHIKWTPGNRVSIRAPHLMYKHLQQFINLLIFSPRKEIKDQAYVLSRAAMLSTGAFDRNINEIDAWFLFLPGYDRDKPSAKSQGIEALQHLSAVVISFLCDAVSTIGNNLYKYLDRARCIISKLKGVEDVSLDFSPLVICALEKCIRLLDSGSGTFKVSEKSMISMYVCNTLSFLLQTQVREGLFSALIDLVLTERFDNRCPMDDDSGKFLCEWRPLKNLLFFAHSISHQQACNGFSSSQKFINADGSSFIKALGEVKRILRSESHGGLGVARAFSSSLICTAPDNIVENFPSVIVILQHFGVPQSFLSSMFFLERDLLANVADVWPHILLSGLEMVRAMMGSNYKDDNTYLTSDITNVSSGEGLLSCVDFDSIESASAAFSSFLKDVPFYMLFPAILTIGNSCFLDMTRMQDLLLSKFSEESSDGSFASLRLLLFWVHQIQLSYRIRPLGELEKLFGTCFVLIKHLLTRLLLVNPDIDGLETMTYIPEIVETIFKHPAVTAFLSLPLCCNEELRDGSFGDSLEAFMSSSKHRVHPLDHHILDILTIVSEYLLNSCSSYNSMPEVNYTAKEQLIKSFNALAQQLVLVFKEKFDLCIGIKDFMPLVPTFYVFHALSHFMCPFELLELVEWIFCEVDQNDFTDCKDSKVAALSLGLYIADGAFVMLSSSADRLNTNMLTFHLFSEIDEGASKICLLEKIYSKVVELATCSELDCAYLCLLKAVNVVYKQNYIKPQAALLPISMAISRMILGSPMKMLSHCIYEMSSTKAKLLFVLTEVSPLHLSLFGEMFLHLLNKDLPVNGDMRVSCNYTLSDEEFVMLLPVVFSYLNSIRFRNQYQEHFECILSLYSKILLVRFSNWKSYVSGDIFQEEYGELPTSTEKFLKLVNSSLLGKAVQMLKYYFSISKDSMRLKKRLKLFDAICPRSGACGDFLDFDFTEINMSSLEQVLNFINKVVGKVSFSKLLLFPWEYQHQAVATETDGDPKEMPLGVGSNREDFERLRFMNILVNSWHKIVNQFPIVADDSEKSENTNCTKLFRHLESFVLGSIVELSKQMQNSLIKLHSIPFLKHFIRSTLLHRFQDPTTMEALHIVLSLLSEGKFSFGMAFNLLLAHSQFVSTILWSDSISESSGLSHAGILLRPISSILRTFVSHTSESAIDGKSSSGACDLYKKKLGVIKLLRVLYHLKGHNHNSHSGKDVGMNSKELLSLLLSCYGATLSEVDLEIFNLMLEIESTEGSECGSIAEMDYLWGCSALKLRREQVLEKVLSSNNIVDCETVEERRRRQFRENIPINPKLCVTTVLHFPYDRVVYNAATPVEKSQKDINVHMIEKTPSTSLERIQRYDPAFILRFSIHGLSMGYVEPSEFAGLGLLAIAFLSISSPDEGIRKLGYEVLARFKSALEVCRNRKEGLRFRLLLTYLQNGIDEPWQRIPSITAIFSAEASLILLDPSHDHYPTITKLLMRSPRVNLKCVPLFNTFFGSTSVSFKTDRLWILRLSYAGLNLDLDAQIFIRKLLLEILLGFYFSSFSDYDSQILILEILKKSVKLHILARYLVEHCGLISWLSSALSVSSERLHGDEKNIFLRQITIVVEVVKDVISFRNIIEWLQKYAFEQLSELSSHLHKLLIIGLELIKQNVPLVNSILHIVFSTLRISQKRRIYQPHFTLSVEGLFQLYQAIDDGFSNMRSGPNTELLLKAILMSTPPTAILHMVS